MGIKRLDVNFAPNLATEVETNAIGLTGNGLQSSAYHLTVVPPNDEIYFKFKVSDHDGDGVTLVCDQVPS